MEWYIPGFPGPVSPLFKAHNHKYNRVTQDVKLNAPLPADTICHKTTL